MSDDLKSLLKALPDEISRQATKIISDYSSGSQELNDKILLLLYKARSLRTIGNLILVFKKSFPQFAVIQNTLNQIELKLTNSSLHEIKNFIKETLEDQNSRFENLYKKVEKKIFRGIKILTFSNSYTCFKLFEKIYLKGFEPEIFVPESNPGGEGKILYYKIKKIGAKTQLVKDRNLDKIISKVDTVIIGADKILPEHFINKIGTKRLVKLAKKHSKPVYVFCLKEKVVKDKQKLSGEKYLVRKKDEILFEKIEIDLITEIFLA